MGNPSLGVQLGRLAGQQDIILKELSDARDDRKQQFSTIDEIRGSVIALDGRMIKVEETLTKFSPTIEEFIQIKNKVLGAGKLGKWLWIVLVALIGLAFKFRTEIVTWFGK
jgi:hypothetical protein